MRAGRAFIDTIFSQRDCWILWTPVPLACGIGFYFSLNFEPQRYVGCAALAALSLCIAPFFRNRAAVYAWLPFFLFALGFTAAQARTAWVEAPALHKKVFASDGLQGRVIAVDTLGTSHRVVLDGISFQGAAPEGPTPERARIRLKKNDPAVPEEGDEVRLRAVLMPLPVPVAPGAYDFQRASYFKKLGATGFALSDIETVKKREGGYFFEGLRRTIREKVYAADTGGPRNVKGIMVAFMIGDTGGITEEDWEIARQSGIAHLIAISGSHFVMIVGVFFFIVRAILAAFPQAALRWPVRKIAAAAGICVAVFYVLLIGAPVSAQRAALMSSLIMLAVMIDRDPFTLRVAAFAAFMMLLFTPEALVGAGFQMSFAAVVGLIAFYESASGLWKTVYRDGGALRRAGLFLLGCLLTTLVASLAVMPFSFFHFLRDSVIAGLAANMVAVPVSSFVTFPLALLAGLLMPLGLEQWPLWAAEESIALIMRVSEAVIAWPHTAIAADAWPVWWLAVISVGGLWICLWRGNIRWLGVLPVIVAVGFIAVRERPDALAGSKFKLLAAVRDDAGKLWFSPGRADGFIRDAWTEREGGAGIAEWPEDGVGANGALSCTQRRCVFAQGERKIVFVKDSSVAKAEDCLIADFVVTPEGESKDSPCGKKTVGKWELYRKGTHLFYLQGKGLPHVGTVADWRGERPWVWPLPRYRPSKDQ